MPYTYDEDWVYLTDRALSVLGWGCGKGQKRVFAEQHLPPDAIPQGAMHVNAFLDTIGPYEQLHQPAINQGLVTQQRITDWLHNHAV
jgi:hypothetical protein